MPKDSNYWTNRISRRDALRASGAGVLGAAFLTACGGSDDSSSGSSAGGTTQAKDSSGLLTKPTDTSKNAKRGGQFTEVLTNHFSWDPNANPFGGHFSTDFVYSRMNRFGLIGYDEPMKMTIEGDFANAWEVSDGGLTITYKLRPNMKFDDRAPTNGRVADSSDVKFSWDRWASGNPRAYEVSNAKNPTAPITSVQTPDARTVVFKLVFPYAPFFPLMNDNFRLIIMPKEADGGYDPKATARGTGAWMIDEDRWPTQFTVKRNPNWYEKERPYYDQWTSVNIPEYATGLAQLRAGSLDTYAVRQEDVLTTKRDVPGLQMVQQANFTKAMGGVIYFGGRPGSPFLDSRVRSAMSMMIDRDLWLDTFSNRQKFEATGLPVQTTWTGWVGPGYDFFLDPRKDEIGEGGKNMRYNVAEAKKLLAAAGQRSPINTPFWTANTAYTPERQAVVGMIEATGDFKAEIRSVPLDEFIRTTQSQFKAWDFDGFAMQVYNETADWDWVHSLMFDPLSTNFNIPKEDPKMTEFYNGQRRELDTAKRASLLKEFQKYAATTMYYIPSPPGQWKNFRLAQPWVGNFGYIQPWNTPVYHQEQYTTYWYDASKKPA